jgi:hypothetical protein
MTKTMNVNEAMLYAAQEDCKKRIEKDEIRNRNIGEFKSILGACIAFFIMALVGLRIGYPEFFLEPAETEVQTQTQENTIVKEIEIDNNIVDSESNKHSTLKETMGVSYETVYVTAEDNTAENTSENKTIENEFSEETANLYDIEEWEINLLVQAVQHETGCSPDFYPYGDYDTVQQYMAASILNRIGQPGFGTNYTTAYSVYDVLANPIQYGSLLWEIDGFDPYDYRTRQNVLAVINGEAWTPDNLYFERCSYIGEDYWSAQDSFYGQYNYNPNLYISYMSLTSEGRYIIFACNPGGAY